MPCNPDLYPINFPTSIGKGSDAIALRLSLAQRTAEAIAISILQNQRTYGYDIALLQESISGGSNSLMPLTIVSGASLTAPQLKGSRGYWGGGSDTPTQYPMKQIERFTFADKALSRLGFEFANSRLLVGTFASKTNGYWFGGQTGDVDRVAFSGEIFTKVGTVIDVNHNLQAVGLTSKTAGYALGGCLNTLGYYGNTSASTAISKLAFANDAISLLAVQLPAEVWAATGVSSVAAGYVAGGNNGLFLTRSAITKFTYASESCATLGTTLFNSFRNAAALNNDKAGYFVAGLSGTGYYSIGEANNSASPALRTIQKMNYANESLSLLGAGYSFGHWGTSGLSNNLFGYTAGPFLFDGGISINTIHEFDFTAESLSLLGVVLSQAKSPLSTGVSDYSPGA